MTKEYGDTLGFDRLQVGVGINGMGRTGRQVLRAIQNNYPNLSPRLINDLGDVETIALLQEYDTTYGRYPKPVAVKDGKLVLGQQEIRLTQEPNPSLIPWGEESVDIIVEATGQFNDSKLASLHLSGSDHRKVIVCSPSLGADFTVILGTESDGIDLSEYRILSAGSCTTCALAPILNILSNTYELASVVATTVHSFTNSQRLLDKAKTGPRDSRAASVNIVPMDSGSSKLIPEMFPRLRDRFIARSIRVPTMTVSLLDIALVFDRVVLKEEINYLFSTHSESDEYKGILGYTDTPLVSSDFRMRPESAVISGYDTRAIGKTVSILAWYDHEYGYACRVADVVALAANALMGKN